MGSGVGMASDWSDCLHSLWAKSQHSTRCNLRVNRTCRENKQLLEGGAGLMMRFVQRVERQNVRW